MPHTLASRPAALAAILLAMMPAVARSAEAGPPAPGGGECVPFARLMSGIQLYGDAWTWWDQAKGRYRRGSQPRVGAVLVFRASGAMRLGHLAVVSRVIAPRVAMVTHANWSRIGGHRGQMERDVTIFDVSDAGDWSRVRVWYNDNDGLGGGSYATYGFIYGKPAPGAEIATAAPAADLSGPSPDIVGAIIDTIR